MLSYLEIYSNKSENQSPEKSPTEFLLGFNVRDTVEMLSQLPVEHFARLPQLNRDQADDSIAFFNAFQT